VQAFTDFKRLWDPQNRMNTGKVVNLEGPVYTATQNLRVGPDYGPPDAPTHFSFAADRHEFGRAALRCVGVGVCRREGGGTMCPSYMVTREERHSTRGRAHLLFEMMNGELVKDGWKSEAVKDALDLCLSCKGCKGDCPVNVDMATYKAEFLSHYYDGKLRPRHAYAFGFIHRWARLASRTPGLANLFTQTPLLSGLAKAAAGAHPNRRIPAFAPRSFQSWFRVHEAQQRDGRNHDRQTGNDVLLFPDTFNNYFRPQVAAAATRVLERAGYRVVVPVEDVCCGRPLYDYGFLEAAKHHWTDLLARLRPHLQARVPIVVLEPSCYSAFKDELGDLMPDDQDARRLGELVMTFSDFVQHRAEHLNLPKLGRRALIHGHCHQKSLDARNDKEVGKLFAERAVLERLGLELRQPETGCCGMAGAFGYEKANDHYEVSVACGERVLLPEVRRAEEEDIVIADGFSCSEQIEQSTHRQALHIAQVLDLATGEGLPAGAPERPSAERRERALRASVRRAGLGMAMIGAAVLAFGWWSRRWRGRG
jgi:Fe-S oxidoreductase